MEQGTRSRLFIIPGARKNIKQRVLGPGGVRGDAYESDSTPYRLGPRFYCGEDQKVIRDRNTAILEFDCPTASNPTWTGEGLLQAHEIYTSVRLFVVWTWAERDNIFYSQEAPSTQCRAFQNIVTLITLFPGLRLLFLRSKYIQCRNQTRDRISALWERSDNSPDEEWEFWRSFTATSLSDMNISAILEECSVLQLTQCGPSLSVIERLLVAHDCEVRRRDVSRRDLFPIYCSALCIRYLGGILALPGFWIEMGSTIYQEVARKICSTMVGVLQDLRVDIDQLEDISEPEAPSDYEGADLLADTILNGISGWLKNMDSAKWRHQLWYGKFLDVVGLLRQSRSADFLPNSYAHATSEAFSSLMLLVPPYDEKFDIRIGTDEGVNRHAGNLNSHEDRTMGETDALISEPRIKSDTTLFPGNVGNETEAVSAEESLRFPSPLPNSPNPTNIRSETTHSSILLEASPPRTGMDVKQNKKEAERMQRELEKRRRAAAEKKLREQATAVMQKRSRMSTKELDGLEWRGGPSGYTYSQWPQN
ncbi:hypothetical protein B0H13DRAFT_2410280 [Mycena leptocephala]|nr:hypothetical protein B0H13DRAFT_2410280 [Mycena leptocephala]